WAKNVYWVFGVVVTEEFGCSKDSLQFVLTSHGIETRSFFTPAHKQPFLKEFGIKGDFPKSTFIHRNGFYLPSYAELSDSEIEDICRIIRNVQIENNQKLEYGNSEVEKI